MATSEDFSISEPHEPRNIIDHVVGLFTVVWLTLSVGYLYLLGFAKKHNITIALASQLYYLLFIRTQVQSQNQFLEYAQFSTFFNGLFISGTLLLHIALLLQLVTLISVLARKSNL